MLRWPKPCSHNPPRPSTAPWEDNRKVVTPPVDFCTHETEVIVNLEGSIHSSTLDSSLTFCHNHFVLSVNPFFHYHPLLLTFSDASIYFLKLYSRLAPYLNISILPWQTSVCLCTFGLFYSVFLSQFNQNSTCSSLDAAARDKRCDDDFKRFNRLSI